MRIMPWLVAALVYGGMTIGRWAPVLMHLMHGR
jgi:hypothetical protein